MTAAILEFEDQNGKQRINVRQGQSLLIGASNTSDIQLEDATHVAPLHCEVTFASGTLAIKDLTDGKRPLHVNGNPIKRQRLNDGDLFDVGQNRFQVIIKTETNEEKPQSNSLPVIAGTGVAAAAGVGMSNQPSPEPQSKMEFPVNEPEHTAQPESPNNDSPNHESTDDGADEPVEEEAFQILDNGLKKIVFSSPSEELFPAMENSDNDWQFSLVANSSIANIQDQDERNLLEEYDESFHEGNRLHLIPKKDSSEFWKLFARYRDKNSAVLLASRAGSTPSEDDLAGVAGWFISPTRLNFNLDNASDSLLNRLFSLTDLILIPQETGQAAIGYVFEATVTDESKLMSWINGND